MKIGNKSHSLSLLLLLCLLSALAVPAARAEAAALPDSLTAIGAAAFDNRGMAFDNCGGLAPDTAEKLSWEQSSDGKSVTLTFPGETRPGTEKLRWTGTATVFEAGAAGADGSGGALTGGPEA